MDHGPADLLLHPVRLRVVHALAGGRVLTTTQLCERLSGVSKVTVYRHVALLAEAGFLEVAEERRVRGAVERHYRLREDRPVADGAAAAEMSTETTGGASGSARRTSPNGAGSCSRCWHRGWPTARRRAGIRT